MSDPTAHKDGRMDEKVDDFLAAKFAEYRALLRNTSPCISFMPYGWFRAPQTIRLDAEFGLQQMAYRDLADEAARDLANGINHLIGVTTRLEAWKKVMVSLDLHQKNEILHEFVQDLATMALLSPYTLKARFYFAVAHLSHQANVVRLRDEWTDDFSTLPEDWAINEEWASKLTKSWRGWRALIRALNKVDDGNFKTRTEEFRSKHTHRFTPRIELGITQMVKRERIPDQSRPRYGIGGSLPLTLDMLIPALNEQCICLGECYSAFEKLVEEQSRALFSNVHDD
ncbi:hypothetical protein PCC82_12450 [Agrobacterium deltaense]